MREELLAHVVAAFEQEATRLRDERDALERTAERFGNPGELTGRLREAIPARAQSLVFGNVAFPTR